MAEEEELPLDVVEQILIQLDVKDLLRYKSVCKSWQSLISNPLFVKSHLNHSYVNDRDSHEFGHRKMIVSAAYNYDVLVVGSCNGLVCVSPSSDHFELVVTNPSTRELKELQTLMSPRNAFMCCGFGYDSAIDDYKVVVGLRTDELTTLFHVLTLKSNTWKFIGKAVNYVSVWYRTGILCDGALHWFMEDAMWNQVIMSLDLSTHEFKEISLPAAEYEIYDWYKLGFFSLPAAEYEIYDWFKLGIIEECLCMYRSLNPVSQKIWVMRSNKWEVYNDIDQESSGKYDYDVVHQLTTSYNVYGVDEGQLVPAIRCGNIFVKSLVSPNNNYAKQQGHEDNESVESRGLRKRNRSVEKEEQVCLVSKHKKLHF